MGAFIRSARIWWSRITYTIHCNLYNIESCIVNIFGYFYGTPDKVLCLITFGCSLGGQWSSQGGGWVEFVAMASFTVSAMWFMVHLVNWVPRQFLMRPWVSVPPAWNVYSYCFNLNDIQFTIYIWNVIYYFCIWKSPRQTRNTRYGLANRITLFMLFNCNFRHAHWTLKLRHVDHGQFLDGWPTGKTGRCESESVSQTWICDRSSI